MRFPHIRNRRKALTCAIAAAALAGGGAAVAIPMSANAATANCADVNLVYAQGTGEVGGVVVGVPLQAALSADLRAKGKSESYYAVNYPASLAPNSASQGNTDLVNHVKQVAAACPNTEFVLAGYSQGANVVDNSLGFSSFGALVGGPITETIPSSIEPRIAAILLFGNPERAIGKHITGTYASRVDEFCAAGDPVCGNGINVLAHLTYGVADAAKAAQFAASKITG